MEAIEKMIKSVKSVVNNFDDMVLDLVMDREGLVTKLNTDALLSGRDANDAEIEPPYSKPYARRRERRGLPTDRVTLKFEGEFHMDFYIERGVKAFELKSRNWKAGFLEKKYGPSIYGLRSADIAIVSTAILNALIESTRKKLFQ